MKIVPKIKENIFFIIELELKGKFLKKNRNYVIKLDDRYK